MIYDKESASYLGSTLDATGTTVDGFKIEKDIHIVFNYGTIEQFNSSKPYIEVKGNEDKYLFTPYAIFAQNPIFRT